MRAKPEPWVGLFAAFLAVAGWALDPSPAPSVRCYITGGGSPLRVCHHPADEGLYYQPPWNQLAYNVQILKLPAQDYITLFHSEARASAGTPRSGDSIKVGSHPGPFNYSMPANIDYKIWGSTTDIYSTLYYRIGYPNRNALGASGGGNPMMVAGKSGDPYFYLFFLAVTDGFQYRADDWRHFLQQARTRDFVNFELRTQDSRTRVYWAPFNDSSSDFERRPLALNDTNGHAIMSNKQDNTDSTQGLIGSIVSRSWFNGVYYYFYTDMASQNSTTMNLYFRSATDVSVLRNAWSAPVKINDKPLPLGTIVRVAKAKGMDRWALLYNCYALGTDRSDICLQYTENLDIIGSGGISSVDFFANPNLPGWQALRSSYFLGLNSGDKLKAQHYFMTDAQGALASPDAEPGWTRGGILTWTEMTPSPWGAAVYRAGWDVSSVSTSGFSSASTPVKASPYLYDAVIEDRPVPQRIAEFQAAAASEPDPGKARTDDRNAVMLSVGPISPQLESALRRLNCRNPTLKKLRDPALLRCYGQLDVTASLPCLSKADFAANYMNIRFPFAARELGIPQLTAPGFAFTLEGCRAAKSLLETFR